MLELLRFGGPLPLKDETFRQPSTPATDTDGPSSLDHTLPTPVLISSLSRGYTSLLPSAALPPPPSPLSLSISARFYILLSHNLSLLPIYSSGNDSLVWFLHASCSYFLLLLPEPCPPNQQPLGVGSFCVSAILMMPRRVHGGNRLTSCCFSPVSSEGVRMCLLHKGV